MHLHGARIYTMTRLQCRQYIRIEWLWIGLQANANAFPLYADLWCFVHENKNSTHTHTQTGRRNLSNWNGSARSCIRLKYDSRETRDKWLLRWYDNDNDATTMNTGKSRRRRRELRSINKWIVSFFIITIIIRDEAFLFLRRHLSLRHTKETCEFTCVCKFLWARSLWLKSASNLTRFHTTCVGWCVCVRE